MLHEDVIHEPRVPSGGIRGLRDGLILGLARAMTRGRLQGRLEVVMPSGRTKVIGSGGTLATSIQFKSMRPIWRAVRRGALGVAESYFDGDIEVGDLGAFIRFCADNSEALTRSGRGLFATRVFDKIAHRRRRNTRNGARRNIAAHYDLGNDFYRLWLDQGMAYSSAIYRDRGLPLETAQAVKWGRILDALEIAPGHELLEIGCGWGGMAEAAARHGAKVKAITLSAEQRRFAEARLRESGLADRTAVCLEDYRDTTGKYDRIVSVEMIEAVGEENWPKYFETLAARLTSGGSAVIQAITIAEEYFESYRKKPDLIQRYIFPGGMLPTVSAINHHAEQVGLAFETIERFGESYALTLRAWRDRFRAAWPAISELGFDERFRRMWDCYLTYCEVGFERATIDVGIYRLRKCEAAATAPPLSIAA